MEAPVLPPVLEIVLPVFCLVAAGYAAARLHYLPMSVEAGLATYVVSVGIPVLLGRAVATMSFGDVSPWSYWGTYFGGFFVCWVAGLAIMAFVFHRDMRTATVGALSAGFSNLVLMGIPLVGQAYGEAGLQILFLLLAVHLPLLLTVSTFAMELAARNDGMARAPFAPLTIAKRLAGQLIRNPIIIGILLGAAWRLLDPSLPDPAVRVGTKVMDLLGQTTGPLALFALGMGAAKFGLKGDILPAFVLAILALFALPTVVWLLATYIFELPTLWLQVAVTAAACPTGVNAYLFAKYFNVAERLAANTILLALGGSIFTVPLWLTLVA